VNIPTRRSAATAPRFALYLGLGALLLLLAIATAFLASRGSETAKSKPPAAAAKVPVASKGPEDRVDRSDPELAALYRVFEAATGHDEPYQVAREDGEATIVPVEIVELPFGKALLTEEEVIDGCHVCAGALGIYYFREEAGKIVVTGRWPRAVKGWGWGKPPAWQLTRKFTSLPAIWEAGHDMHIGIESKGASLTELRPGGPARSDPIDTSHQDDGAPDPNGRGTCSVRGQIVNTRPDVGFDVQLTGDVTAVDRYRKRNGRFVAVSKVDWQDLCPHRGPPPPDSDPSPHG